MIIRHKEQCLLIVLCLLVVMPIQAHAIMNEPADSIPICPQEEEEIVGLTVVEQMPEFPGGKDSLFNYIKLNQHYPRLYLDCCIMGRVIVQFWINETGAIENACVLRGIHPAFDAEAIRLVASMPNWKPGMQRGKPIRVKYVLPIRFEPPVPEVLPIYKAIENDTLQKVVFGGDPEQMPMFPGGQEALFHYLQTHIHYPQEAVEQNIEGRAILQFWISETGALENIVVVRSSGSDLLDREAYRVILNMPSWLPAMNRGNPVRHKYTLPVNFKLKLSRQEQRILKRQERRIQRSK